MRKARLEVSTAVISASSAKVVAGRAAYASKAPPVDSPILISLASSCPAKSMDSTWSSATSRRQASSSRSDRLFPIRRLRLVRLAGPPPAPGEKMPGGRGLNAAQAGRLVPQPLDRDPSKSEEDVRPEGLCSRSMIELRLLKKEHHETQRRHAPSARGIKNGVDQWSILTPLTLKPHTLASTHTFKAKIGRPPQSECAQPPGRHSARESTRTSRM